MTLRRGARLGVALAVPVAAWMALAVSTFASPTSRAHGDWGVAYAPVDTTSPRPAIVFLHGMWASPEDSCDSFVGPATPFGFLVCPRGNARLRVPLDAGALGTTWVDDDNDAGLKMWSGSATDAARSIHAALDAAETLAPGKRARPGGTLRSRASCSPPVIATRRASRWKRSPLDSATRAPVSVSTRGTRAWATSATASRATWAHEGAPRSRGYAAHPSTEVKSV